MARNRNSAKQAGAKFERSIADCLRDHVSEWIDKKPKYGAKDRGDIANVRTPHGKKVTVECKDYAGRVEAGTWLKEVEVERVNDGAEVGVVVAKRRGHSDPLDQFVLMSMRDYITLSTGSRPD